MPQSLQISSMLLSHGESRDWLDATTARPMAGTGSSGTPVPDTALRWVCSPYCRRHGPNLQQTEGCVRMYHTQFTACYLQGEAKAYQYQHEKYINVRLKIKNR